MKTIEVKKGVRVPLITVRDMMQICDQAFEEERATLVADLDASGVDPQTRLERLREHSQRRGTVSLLLLATFRIATAGQIVRIALERAGLEPDSAIAEMTPEEMVEAAQMLCGYRKAEPDTVPLEPGQRTT
jgi:hypothetical protein